LGVSEHGAQYELNAGIVLQAKVWISNILENLEMSWNEIINMEGPEYDPDEADGWHRP